MKARDNPFAPSRLERLLAFDPELIGSSWKDLETRWQALGRRAAVTGHHGADSHLSAQGPAISRGMRIEKAMDEDTIIAIRMNGQPIPQMHGAPARLLVPGWPGSLSQKWFTRIELKATPHTGRGMGGTSYRVPVRPIVPGSRNNGADFGAALGKDPVQLLGLRLVEFQALDQRPLQRLGLGLAIGC